MTDSPVVEVTYCNHDLRAEGIAQELLTTFAEEIGLMALAPDGANSAFEVRVAGEIVWSGKGQGRFPDIDELKKLVRERIARTSASANPTTPDGR